VALIVFQPALGYTSSEQGLVKISESTAFDVGAALAAGGGLITVDDAIYPKLVAVLTRYPGLAISVSAPGTPVTVNEFRVPFVHSRRYGGGASSVGDTPTLAQDGAFHLGAPPGSSYTPILEVLVDSTPITLGVSANDGGILSSVSQATSFNAATGIPNERGYLLRMRDNVTGGHALTWNPVFRASSGIALPATTTGNGKWDYLSFGYNTADSKWDLLGLAQGF
jgi:hypothetical protein